MRHPHPLPAERLKTLSTHRLLQILKVARRAEIGLYCQCCQMPSWRLGVGERQPWESQKAYDKRRADREARWTQEATQVEQYIADIKAILATREHVKR